jgi:arylsulfatase A-like enzyme
MLTLPLLLACAERPPPAPPGAARPDIFVFSVDTLRADHLEIYGYERNTAPWIASVSQDAVVFDAASATSSWTVPSVASLLTGMLPHQLKVERAPSIAGPDDPRPMLPAGAVTLPERLRAEGYRTFAVTANSQLASELGYAQGFQHYVNVGFATADVVRDAADRLAADIRSSQEPVFVWIHLVDPHDPYDPEPDALARRWSPGLDGYDAQSRLPELSTATMRALKDREDLQRRGPGLEHLEALYDAEITQADAVLKHLARSFEVGDDDVLVITADHGEEFRDHGNLGHRVTLFEETVRVPLVVRWPGHWPARRVKQRVSLASLTPTLAALIGAPPGPEAGLAAGSMLPLLEGRPWAPEQPVVAQLVHVDNKMVWRAIYDGQDKLVVNADGDGPKKDRTRLFELGADPGEVMDAAGIRRQRVEQLNHRMEEFLASLPELEAEWLTGTADPSTIEQLRAMGYVE